MKTIKTFFHTKTAVYYVKLAAYAAALVGAVLYIALDRGDVTYSPAAFILMLAGGAAGLLLSVLNVPAAALVPVALFSAGLGMHAYAALPSISDLFTGVVLFGGNQTMGILFIAWFAVCALVCIVCCFFKDRNADKLIG